MYYPLLGKNVVLGNMAPSLIAARGKVIGVASVDQPVVGPSYIVLLDIPYLDHLENTHEAVAVFSCNLKEI